jgi:hypothetical protein
MHRLFLTLILVLTGSTAFAQSRFPGLKAVLTEAEWKRAGLDRLTPDQLGVIDAALIRHYIQTIKAAEAEAPLASAPEPPPGATPAEKAVARSRFWDRFGLGKSTPDWRKQPPMLAKCTGWQGANRFVLDTGQVWEGDEPIPLDLPGRDVIIEARPMGAFALKLDDNSVVIRVHRVR